ncbi:MAG: TIGR03620 family F420-dependent LLM class oxidoreductase, partial [Deltaproteobacteria bacterium]|nr:TIGR03620 family F420-dependent LLM class oxidoreductase [Deltaproteobacteria bacterium]
FRCGYLDVREWLLETDIVLIPLGSTEQHGRHLPVCTDSIATEVPCMLAAELANVPYYQLIPFGYSPQHFHPVGTASGTVTLSAATYQNVLYEVGRSLIHNGFNKLIFATGIANIWARDPITMSAASKTIGELSGGRFVLGIGVSHKPLVLNLRGHSYDKPYSYMKEYLPKLKTALYKAPMPKEDVPIVIAALHPKMLALAAAEVQGTHTYFVPPEHTAKVRAAIGPKPWICAAQAVILESDATKARAAARTYMKTYVPRLPNYTNNLKNLGWKDEDFANGGSAALVDAIVAWGSETKIRDRIDAHLKAGATHVCILPVKVDSESLPDERAMEALAPK